MKRVSGAMKDYEVTGYDRLSEKRKTIKVLATTTKHARSVASNKLNCRLSVQLIGRVKPVRVTIMEKRL